jgi:shikimate kinase
MNNYYLTGMMGSGKTTIASGLLNKSKINKFKIIDIDSLIVKETKMSINDIFAKYGEKYFRDLETRTLEKISKEDNLIVSCGGGIILRDENLKIMKESGYVIYINRTIKNIISTINTSTRPLLKDGVKKIREIFKKRKQRYFSSADYIIENNKSVNDAITQLLNFSKLPIVGFQGINGSYSNIAANKYFNKKENKFICFPTFEELLDNYEKKIIDYVVIPIFNSTTGEIKQTTDLISKLKYKKELTKITIPIHHNLLALQTSKNIKNI